MQGLKSFDFYKRVHSDFRVQTLGGGTISMLAALFMTLLFTLELWSFISGYESTTIIVDQDSATSIWVNFNTSLPATHCDHISVDVEDMLGTNVMDIQKNVEKISLDENGKQLADLDHSHHHSAPKGHVSEDENIVANAAVTSESYQVHKLTKADFNNYVDSREWVFVYFGATWCHWCQKLDPVWKAAGEVLKNRGAQITMPKVECTQNTALCQAHQIHALPTIQLFHNGHLVPPNYRGPRTVNDLVHFAENAAVA
jgi:thiol-disulfide isomerase/thioredoxin